MARVLDAEGFAAWFSTFLPHVTLESHILTTYAVTDESDGYLAHLNGLNLTRAGQLIRIGNALRRARGTNGQDSTAALLTTAVSPLLNAGLDSVMTDEFMSSHWLASFAWDALTSAAADTDFPFIHTPKR